MTKAVEPVGWAPVHFSAEFYRRGVTAEDVKPGWTRLSDNVIATD
ncbi:hypothetical protein ACFVU2_10675 [Leifsonia sp. NPDC058194]